MDVIEVDVLRYQELLKCEMVYNLYRNKLAQDSYVPELERTLFEVSGKPEVDAEEDDF